MKKKKDTATYPEPFKQEPEMRISLPPDSKLKDALKGLMVEKDVIVEVKGTVVGYNMDKYGCGLTVKIKGIDLDEGLGGDVRRMRKEKEAY